MLLRERLRSSDPSGIADRFRQSATWLILAASILAISLAIGLRVRVDPEGTAVLDWILASILLVSRIWWSRTGHQRIADALGTVALAAMGGMACGAIAMLELRLRFPIADAMLQSWDQQMGFDGIAIVRWQVDEARWLFSLMKPAYNYTLQIFFSGLVLLSLLGDRIEAWRAAFCFVGTLFTTCLIAIFAPAKGLGVWATASLFEQLPEHAMRNFWPHFDEFYFGDDPVLRLQVIDGVISFPSFHAIVGFMTFAMWRRNFWTRFVAACYLVIMLLSTLPGGGHYVVDLVGGFLVWAAWFAFSRHKERQMASVAGVLSVEG